RQGRPPSSAALGSAAATRRRRRRGRSGAGARARSGVRSTASRTPAPAAAAALSPHAVPPPASRSPCCAHPVLSPPCWGQSRLRRRHSPVNGGVQRSLGRRTALGAVEEPPMIEVSRTLMKSEPELAELVATVEGVEVTMAEKGFGTRVKLRAAADSGLDE